MNVTNRERLGLGGSDGTDRDGFPGRSSGVAGVDCHGLFLAAGRLPLTPRGRFVGSLLHIVATWATAEAAPDFSDTASDLHLLLSG